MASALILQPRVDVEVPDALMAWLVQFAEFAGEAKLGLTCTVCRSPVVGGAHGLHEAQLRMSCACRQFVGVNPLVLVKRREQERLTESLKDGTADLSV